MKKGYWLFSCMFMVITMSTSIYARGGGGTSGGGSTGSQTYYPYYPYYSSNGISFLFIIIIVSIGSILYFATRNNTKASNERRELDNQQQTLMLSLNKIDSFWNNAQLQEQVSKAYFGLQYAWSSKDKLAFKPYLSNTLYTQWDKEVEFLNVNKEQNVLESIELLSADIISIQDFIDSKKDYVWVRIKGKMADYYVSEVTGKVRGTKVSLPFCEYWKFIRDKDVILLDEVRQDSEIQENNLTSQSERVISIVCGVMKNEKGYLIGRRDSTVHEHIWEFPGGKVEPKETNEQALIREFQEELEIQIKVVYKLKVYEDVREHEVLQIHAYACEYVAGEIKLHAHHEIQYVPANQLQNYTFEQADQGLLDCVKKHAT